MALVIFEDPDLFAEKETDGEGRVYLGSEFQGRTVRVSAELVEDGDE